VEFDNREDFVTAYKNANYRKIDGHKIIVDYERGSLFFIKVARLSGGDHAGSRVDGGTSDSHGLRQRRSIRRSANGGPGTTTRRGSGREVHVGTRGRIAGGVGRRKIRRIVRRRRRKATVIGTTTRYDPIIAITQSNEY
jgi:hypothetical protein